MNSSEKIIGRIISVAQSEADGIIAEAEKAAREITEEYKKKAAEIAASAEAEISADTENARSRIKTSAEKLARNIMLDAKSAKIDETFEKARLKLISLPDADYEKMLSIMLVSTVKAQIESEKRALEQDTDGELSPCEAYEVLLAPKDKSRVGASMIKEAADIAKSAGKKLSVSDGTANIDGGFILRAGNIEINCSIGLILSQLRNDLEGDVYRILFS